MTKSGLHVGFSGPRVARPLRLLGGVALPQQIHEGLAKAGGSLLRLNAFTQLAECHRRAKVRRLARLWRLLCPLLLVLLLQGFRPPSIFACKLGLTRVRPECLQDCCSDILCQLFLFLPELRQSCHQLILEPSHRRPRPPLTCRHLRFDLQQVEVLGPVELAIADRVVAPARRPARRTGGPGA